MKKLVITIFSDTENSLIDIVEYVQEMLEMGELTENTTWNNGHLEYKILDDASQEFQSIKNNNSR